MRYSLVTFLDCPVCHGDLTAVATAERAAEMPPRPTPASSRIPPQGALVAPMGTRPAATPLSDALARHAASPGPPERDYAVEVEEGLLVCDACGRWFPITELLPELLPDHLRDYDRDARIFERCARALPADLTAALRSAAPPVQSVAGDEGAHYKRAEISITGKVEDPNFFSPGYSSPFNPHDTGFTVYLIKLFGSVMPLLELKRGDVVLDSGCGYSWTTEWLFRAGVDAIGVDICRKYLEIGIARMGANRPHLVVGDVEHMPIREASVDAILAYESFHHIPNRNRAMASYGRILKHGGRVVLAEPGAAHEHAQVAVDVMSKYGILEKGMELADVEGYVAGTPIGSPEQVFVLRAGNGDLGAKLDSVFVRTHSALEGNLFRLRRTDGVVTRVAAAVREPRRIVWPVVKRRVKAALVRLGLD